MGAKEVGSWEGGQKGGGKRVEGGGKVEREERWRGGREKRGGRGVEVRWR